MVSLEYTDETPFSFPEINAWFAEDSYIRTTDLLSTASYLIGDGTAVGLDLNPEYTRGMAELIADYTGLPCEAVGEITECIKAFARERC